MSRIRIGALCALSAGLLATAPAWAAPALTLPSTATVKAGQAALKSTCGAADCTGTLTFTGKITSYGKTKTVTVGKAKVNLTAGQSGTLTLKLSNASALALRHTHKLKTTATGLGVTKTVTLKG